MGDLVVGDKCLLASKRGRFASKRRKSSRTERLVAALGRRIRLVLRIGLDYLHAERWDVRRVAERLASEAVGRRGVAGSLTGAAVEVEGEARRSEAGLFDREAGRDGSEGGAVGWDWAESRTWMPCLTVKRWPRIRFMGPPPRGRALTSPCTPR